MPVDPRATRPSNSEIAASSRADEVLQFVQANLHRPSPRRLSIGLAASAGIGLILAVTILVWKLNDGRALETATPTSATSAPTPSSSPLGPLAGYPSSAQSYASQSFTDSLRQLNDQRDCTDPEMMTESIKLVQRRFMMSPLRIVWETSAHDAECVKLSVINGTPTTIRISSKP